MHRRSQGAVGAPAHPHDPKKILGVIYSETVSAPQHTKCTPRKSKSCFGHFLLCGELELQLVALDRLLKATTKKVVNFFEKKCMTDKILVTLMDRCVDIDHNRRITHYTPETTRPAGIKLNTE